MSDWQPIETAPEGVEVETKIEDAHGERNVQHMVRRGRLWWAGAIYVYYQPTHWRPAASRDESKALEAACIAWSGREDVWLHEPSHVRGYVKRNMRAAVRAYLLELIAEVDVMLPHGERAWYAAQLRTEVRKLTPAVPISELDMD